MIKLPSTIPQWTLVDFEAETQTVTVIATCTATAPSTETDAKVDTNTVIMVASASAVHCSQVDCKMETQTVTIAASSTCAIAENQATCTADTETVTILHPLATTVTVNYTPDNAMMGQSSNSNGSQTVWMAVAILFMVIATSAIVFSIFMGCLLHKKVKAFKRSTTEDCNNGTTKPVGKGKISCNKKVER